MVSIPPVIRGRKVVAVGKSAFAGITIFSSALKEIIIPDTVERIEAGAFCGCTKLEKVTASKNIKYIGFSAFSSCHKLHTLDFGMGPCGYKIVKFPRGLEEIGTQAFTDINGLSCILNEVTLDKKTKVHNTMGFKTFSPKDCAVFYYND